MIYQHLENLKNREKKRILKNIIPRFVRQIIRFADYQKRYPTCFVSSGSIVHSDAIICSNCLIQESSIGPNVKIDDFTTLNHQTRLGGKGYIKIGKYCSIAPECLIWSENHNIDYATTYPLEHILKGYNDKWDEYVGGDITIGNSVWVGQRSIILSGANIGDGCVIAAGSVVPKGDYPPFSIIGGIPAKIIRSRLPEDKIQDLLAEKWWDKNPSDVFGTMMDKLH